LITAKPYWISRSWVTGQGHVGCFCFVCTPLRLPRTVLSLEQDLTVV